MQTMISLFIVATLCIYGADSKNFNKSYINKCENFIKNITTQSTEIVDYLEVLADPIIKHNVNNNNTNLLDTKLVDLFFSQNVINKFDKFVSTIENETCDDYLVSLVPKYSFEFTTYESLHIVTFIQKFINFLPFITRNNCVTKYSIDHINKYGNFIYRFFSRYFLFSKKVTFYYDLEFSCKVYDELLETLNIVVANSESTRNFAICFFEYIKN